VLPARRRRLRFGSTGMEGLDPREERLLEAVRNAAASPLANGHARIEVRVAGELSDFAPACFELIPTRADACPLSICVDAPHDLVGSIGHYKATWEVWSEHLDEEIEVVTEMTECVIRGQVEEWALVEDGDSRASRVVLRRPEGLVREFGYNQFLPLRRFGCDPASVIFGTPLMRATRRRQRQPARARRGRGPEGHRCAAFPSTARGLAPRLCATCPRGQPLRFASGSGPAGLDCTARVASSRLRPRVGALQVPQDPSDAEPRIPQFRRTPRRLRPVLRNLRFAQPKPLGSQR
jgi:hypothetical protein